MSPWWTVLVLALHLVPGASALEPFSLRVFSQNSVILEVQAQERTPGVFSLFNDQSPFPARVERSHIYGQVYTVFSPWDLIPPSIDGELSQDSGLVYAAGSFSPVSVDLTPFLTQDSLGIPGRYTLSWELPGVQKEVDRVDDTELPNGASLEELNLILEDSSMTLLAPNLGLIIQVNGI
ncbi:MAG: hypothetical protein GW949_04070 [Spirochaetales bacterium]|nr:hypothetical protein [Spirochaetales bacterium]